MFGLTLGRMGAGPNYGNLGAAWTPADLFANDEEGVWYDPSDLTTMFQDSTGTTPVTADGQPVGLILDKSKGLVLGSESVPPTAISSTSGWVTTNCTMAIVGDELELTATGTGYVWADLSVVTESTKDYQLEVTFRNGASVFGAQVGINHPGGNAYTDVVTSQISTTKKAINLFGKVNLRFLLNAQTIGNKAYMSFASIKELPGNHASQATAAARPLKTSTGAADWTNYDAVDDVLNTTFPSSLGSSCTVCRANVGAAPTILTAQTIGTSYADSTDNAGLIIINRALTGQETTDVTAWLTAKGVT